MIELIEGDPEVGQSRIVVIIPAINEEKSIGFVIRDIPDEVAGEIIVVDNGSEDNTIQVASSHGATVLVEENKGYGYACLNGIEYLGSKDIKPDIIVFLDGDYSDYPGEITKVVAPVLDGADLVIGARVPRKRETGSMTIPQIFGNWLATFLVLILYKQKFTDLGPFRAIRYQKLLDLKMNEKTYGWTVEMQLKAAKHGLKCVEVPVSYRKRIGISKVSGTLKGTIMAGYKILWTIFKYL